MKKVLIIAPHPDDEAIGLGGAIMQHVAAGDILQTIFMTSGEAGIPGTPAEEAQEIREAEANRASEILGTLPPLFWHQPDGGLRVNAFLVESMRKLMAQVDMVYVTHGDEDHGDHAAAFEIVEAAALDMDKPPKVLLYEVWTPMRRPDVFVDITDHMERKMVAIATHKSQGDRNPFAVASLSLNSFRGHMHSPRHAGYAEAFTRMKGTGPMTTSIVFLTYAPSLDNPRHEYAKRSLQALLSKLKSADPIMLHIADDGSAEGHVAALALIATQQGYAPTFTNANREGYGKSYNLACQVVHDRSTYVMPVEDDWQLLKPLDLDPLQRAIEESQGLINCIRLGYLGATKRLTFDRVYIADQTFGLIHHTSEEHHVLAGHPRLETVAFEQSIGPWAEGIGAGAVELNYCGRQASRVGVAWPLDLGVNASQNFPSLFAHIGDLHIGDEPLAAS